MSNRGHALSREEMVRTLTAYSGTTTSAGAADGSSLIDSKLINENDFLTGKSILILSGDAQWETAGISSFNSATGELSLSPALNSQIVAGVAFRVLNTLPESIHITSGIVQIEGYDYVSGERRLVAVNESGQIEIRATVADIVTAKISGQTVTISSGSVAVVSGEVHVMSGAIAAQISGGVQVSGGVHIESGVVGIVQSGALGVNVSGGVQVSGAVRVSGGVQVSGGVHIESGVVGIVQSGALAVRVSGAIRVSGAVQVSGGVHIESGVVGIVQSGTLGVNVSGGVQVSGAVRVSGTVEVSGTVAIVLPTEVKAGLIRSVISNSGGEVLHSGAVMAAQIKSDKDNSGAIVIGGATNRPWYEARCSGLGFVLDPGEAKSEDIDNFNRIYVVAQVSGDQISFLGVN